MISTYNCQLMATPSQSPRMPSFYYQRYIGTAGLPACSLSLPAACRMPALRQSCQAVLNMHFEDQSPCLHRGVCLQGVYLFAGLYAEAVGRIFKEWEFDSILPCHGDYVARDGKRILQEHLELMGERKRLISP